MERSDPAAVFAALRAAEPDVMERDELVELTRLLAGHRAWCDALQVRVTRRQRELAEVGRAEAPRDSSWREGRQSGRDARNCGERERVCTSMPSFEDALSSGAVAAGHVDAVANATRNLDAGALAEFTSHTELLIERAGSVGVDQFDRECRELARSIVNARDAQAESDQIERQRQMSKVTRWTDAETGMRHTKISLDPVRDAQLWAAIDHARRSLRTDAGAGVAKWEQLQVDAVLAAIRGQHGAAGGVMVLIDEATLRSGVHANTVSELADGTPLPVETVRHMACTAEIIPIVLDGDGRALDVGRSKRLATEAQRQAVVAMYRTCGYPGCDVPVEACEVHHVEPFESGGNTNLDNLLPLCLARGHHHQVHEGGWTLTMSPDRVITLTRPDGAIWFVGPTNDRAPAGVAPGVAAPDDPEPDWGRQPILAWSAA